MSDILKELETVVGSPIAAKAITEIESLRQRVKELENAAYLSQAHVLCNDLGIAPGHIEDRLFEAIGKVRELAALKAGQGEPMYYEITTHDGIKWVGENPSNLPNHTNRPLCYCAAAPKPEE